MRFARDAAEPAGEGRAAVIEEAGEGEERGVKVGRANFVIACDGPEARGGVQSAAEIRN